jgi:hypothetical protein
MEWCDKFGGPPGMIDFNALKFIIQHLQQWTQQVKTHVLQEHKQNYILSTNTQL